MLKSPALETLRGFFTCTTKQVHLPKLKEEVPGICYKPKHGALGWGLATLPA